MRELRTWSTDELVPIQGEKAIADIQRIVELCRPILAGHHPAVQSGALADLTAMWLAGHLPAASREELLAEYLEAVRKLVPVNAAMLGLPE